MEQLRDLQHALNNFFEEAGLRLPLARFPGAGIREVYRECCEDLVLVDRLLSQICCDEHCRVLLDLDAFARLWR